MDLYGYNKDDISTIQLVVYKVSTISELAKAPYNFHLSELDNSEKDLLDTAKYKLDLTFKRLIPATMDEGSYHNLVLIPHHVPLLVDEPSDTVLDPQEAQGSEVPEVTPQEAEVQGKEAVDVNQELPATDRDQEHSQNNEHQSALNLITSVNPKIALDGDISLYRDKGDKHIVSIQNKQAEETTQHDVNIYTHKGSHVLGFTDVKEVGSSTFTRTHSKVTNTISGSGDIIGTRVDIAFDSIKVPTVKKALRDLYIPNPKIGTLDIETYKVGGKSKVYSLAFYTRQNGMKTFYIDPKTLDSDKVVLDCIDALVKPTYANFVFYVHNLGGFDAIFLLKNLIDAIYYSLREVYLKILGYLSRHYVNVRDYCIIISKRHKAV
ncbi:hypothetical protein BDR22DRAFT_895889 [Usnea florida]